jgi:tetratricopeptide (TPR) repeat protein
MAKLTINKVLQQAVDAHKAGQLQEAHRLYAAILKVQPKHTDANHNMGLLAVGFGEIELALPFFKTALEVNPNIAQFWYSHIVALIKLERLIDAKVLLDQAKIKGIKGADFDRLEQKLNDANKALAFKPDSADAYYNMGIALQLQCKLEEAIEAYNKALSIKPDYASAYYNIGIILQKQNKLEEAVEAYNKTLAIEPDYVDAYNNMGNVLQKQHKLGKAIEAYKKALSIKPDYADAYKNLGIVLKDQGKLEEAIKAYNKALAIEPDYANAYYNIGNILQEQNKLEEAVEAYNKTLAIEPDYVDAYNNMGNILHEQGKLEEAIEAYNKVLSIKPDYADAYNNLGIVLKDQGKLEEAIEAYKKTLAVKPDYADAYNNMGVTLHEQSKLEEAIEAYNKALSIKPDYVSAYNNMGNALKEQDKLEEAIEAYNKAVSIKPDYAEAHRHLSTLTKYTLNDPQISVVEDLLQREKLNDSDRLHLHYTYAKMQEDLGDLSLAFDSYVTGGDLRQKSLAYEFSQDEHLFGRIKQTAPQFKDIALNVTGEPIRHTPIFILGMPRSGTTLVEQIVSSHSEVTGAGELAYVSQFGGQLATGLTASTVEAVSLFRDCYLAELAKRANGQAFITDKMPQNFQYIALICAAFPEAKIVHVQRSAEATCWSNFKHYFVSKGLGYSYNLSDTVRYYGLYQEIMHFWGQNYSDRIYNLDYDKLTEDQEPETQRLIEYLELNWQDTCLTPQKNKRSVKTASQQQVRQKVYKGSSQVWRKYESCLNGVFDGLKSIVK